MRYWSVWILYMTGVIRLLAEVRCFTVKLYQSSDSCSKHFTSSLIWTVNVTLSHMTSLLLHMNLLTLGDYKMWNVMIQLTLVCKNFVTVDMVYICIYLDQIIFLLMQENENCNVVFIWSRAVVSVTFMRCEMVCIKNHVCVTCVTLQLWASYQRFHLQSGLEDWCRSSMQNVDTNLVRLPEDVNPIFPAMRTLNIISYHIYILVII